MISSHPSQLNLANHDARVFADGVAAVDALHALGLDAKVPIWTLSPRLHLDKGIPTRRLDEGIGLKELDALDEAIYNLAIKAYTLAAEYELPHEAGVLATACIYRFQNPAHKAMMLIEDDYNKPAVVTAYRADTEWLDATLNAPWSDLLSTNDQLLCIHVSNSEEAGHPKDLETARNASASFLVRLRYESLESIGYRVLEKVGHLVAKRVGRGRVWMAHESGLAKDVAFWLALSGRLPIKLRHPRLSGETCVILPNEREYLSRLSLAFDESIAQLVTQSSRKPLRQILISTMSADLMTFRSSEAGWKDNLEDSSPADGDVIFLSPGNGAADLALAKVARDAKIPAFTFQHGITREIAEPRRTLELGIERARGTAFLTYGPRSAELFQDSPFSCAKGVAVGASSDMLRAARRSLGSGLCKRPLPKIFYVSTGLYAGNIQPPATRRSRDIDIAAFEIDLIEKVFAKLSARVFYKTYPHNNRYPDHDPVISVARQYENIEPYETPIDLRYLLHSARLLITHRATSTFGWCLASGLPLVLIQHPAHKPLAKDLRPLLEQSLFVFDVADEPWPESLRTFLNRPFAEVDSEWRAKARARAELNEILLGQRGNAGRRGAALVRAYASAGADEAEHPHQWRQK